jgi:protein translocase SecG subunit
MGAGDRFLLHTFIFIVQVLTALLLVFLMAIQTDKAEQGGGGVMGIGAAGGRSSSNINLPVGAERILKPLTTWTALGFLASSLLNALPKVTFIHVLAIAGIYVLLMIFGGAVWRALTSAFGR